MSRELRRHPPQKKGATRDQRAVSFRAPPKPQAPAPRSTERRPFWKRLVPRPQPVVDIVSELKKVTWPTLTETRHLSTMVIIVAVAVGLVLGGIDLAFSKIMEQLLF